MPWAADAAILRRVLDQPPTFPCIAPAHTVGRWLRDAAKHGRRLLPDEVWPRQSLGLPAPGELGSPAPDLEVCLWWFGRLHEAFFLGRRTERLEDASLCTLADAVASPPIRNGSKFRAKFEPDWVSPDTGKPEPSLVLHDGRVKVRVGLSALLHKTIVTGHVLLAHAAEWRPRLAAAQEPGGAPMTEPLSAAEPDPGELRRIARVYRELRERLLRVAEQIQDGGEGKDRLHRLGAQCGRLLAAAIKAGAGHPFDQWFSSPRLEPEIPGGPPSEVNEDLWWLYWASFSDVVGRYAQPMVPGNFGRLKWEVIKHDAGSGIVQFTTAQPVSDPPHVWRDRIEDHAALCGLVADELEERAERAQSAAEKTEEARRRVLIEALDAFEELLDHPRVRRAFCRRVEAAALDRRRWIDERCLPQLREVVEASERIPTTNGEAPQAGALLRSMVPAAQRGGAANPERVALEQAVTRHEAARREAERDYNRWAREHAADPPLCCAFLFRWHRSARAVVGFLPELSGELAAAFDPAELPIDQAPVLLEAVRQELKAATAQRRPLASDAKLDGWTKQELCSQGGIGGTTFDRICVKAGVARPESGQHGYRFGEDDLEKLIAVCETFGKRKWPEAGKRWRLYLDAAKKAE